MNFFFKFWTDAFENQFDRFTSFQVLLGDEVSLLEFENLYFELDIIEEVELLLGGFDGWLEWIGHR